MGVRGLATYVEQYAPGVCVQVSIPEMAARYRVHNSDMPVLLVDGMALLRKLYVGALEWIYGGQWRQFVLLVERFVNNFIRNRVKLVFIFDGSVESKKRDTWVSRRQQHQGEIRQIFENIKRYHQQPPDGVFQLPSTLATMVRFLLKYQCKCEVFSSLVDADLEIARMARQRADCFAILSEDTDFFIFDTKPYLSIKHLNLETFHTVMYCPSSLSRSLCLDPRQLPLFASLMGNDVVSHFDLRPFHQRITSSARPSFQFLPPCVANFIAGLGSRANDPTFVARTVGISASLLEESLSSYALYDVRPPCSNDPRDDVFRQRHVFCFNCPQVYDFLVKKEAGFSECLEDPPTTGLPASCLTLQPLRRRLYGLLVGAPVREWLTFSEQTSTDPVTVTPSDFGMRSSTDWSKLWSDKNDAQVTEHRWLIFLSCVGVTLRLEWLTTLTPSLAVFSIILNYYLLHQKSLMDWEVHALLVQAISPSFKDLPFIHQLRVDYVDERAVQIASMIMRGLITVLWVSQCCLEPLATKDVLPWHFFDGKLFHYYYLQAKNGASLQKMYRSQKACLRKHEEIYRMITDGTYVANSSSNKEIATSTCI